MEAQQQALHNEGHRQRRLHRSSEAISIACLGRSQILYSLAGTRPSASKASTWSEGCAFGRGSVSWEPATGTAAHAAGAADVPIQCRHASATQLCICSILLTCELSAGSPVKWPTTSTMPATMYPKYIAACCQLLMWLSLNVPSASYMYLRRQQAVTSAPQPHGAMHLASQGLLSVPGRLSSERMARAETARNAESGCSLRQSSGTSQAAWR